MEKIIYPFTAIVGQTRMKRALVLNLVNPSLGGVLIRGEKGTAKSTAVRALADLLPLRGQMKGCPFSCSPTDIDRACDDCREKILSGAYETVLSPMKVVDLPVSATEDRVVGTLDIERALKKGEKRFEPGLLAQANRNILYVDEVNLLDDRVVDILLDSAAMGVSFIEREGISFSHPASFTLVGTMNPEEGDLRPQLLDRFGLVVDIRGEDDVKKRAEVIRRRLAFERDPERFKETWAPEQDTLAQKIAQAAALLPHVAVGDRLLEAAALISTSLEVDGHRADIVMIKTAVTLAALEGRESVTEDNLKEAASYALPHRMRRLPFDASSLDAGELETRLGEILAQI